MFLRRRVCYISASLARFPLIATPNEPLSFLYPSWFRFRTVNAEHTTATTGATQSLVNRPSGHSQDEKLSTVPNIGHAAGVFGTWGQYPPAIETDTATLNASFGPGHSSRRSHVWSNKSLKDSVKVSSATANRLLKTEQLMHDFRLGISSTTDREKGLQRYKWYDALFELKALYRERHSVLQLNPPPALVQSPRIYQDVRAQDIPPPALWSSSSFAGYIVDLTRSQCSRPKSQILYRVHTSHEDEVEYIMMMLFQDDSLRSYLTTYAFDTAIRWSFKNEKLFNVSQLLSLMIELNVPIIDTTWTTLLRVAASVKDVDMFIVLLRIMYSQGASPDAYSWVSLLKAIRDKQGKLYVLDEMRDLGVLKDPVILRAAVLKVLPIFVSEHADQDQPLELLLLHLDSKFGPEWMTPVTAVALCSLLGKHGLTPQAVSLHSIAQDRGIDPPGKFLIALLPHCKPTLAIEVLKLFRSNDGLTLLQEDLDVLFRLSWRSQRLNTCKVIWRAACLQSAVGSRMQELVLRSLICNTPKIAQTRDQLWMKTAGKVIVGLDHIPAGNLDKSAPGWKVLEILSQWATWSTERVKSFALAKKVLARDLRSAQSYVLAEDFLVLYEKALKLDIQWEREERHVLDTLWKIEHSINVPISRRQGHEAGLSRTIVRLSPTPCRPRRVLSVVPTAGRVRRVLSVVPTAGRIKRLVSLVPEQRRPRMPSKSKLPRMRPKINAGKPPTAGRLRRVLSVVPTAGRIRRMVSVVPEQRSPRTPSKSKLRRRRLKNNAGKPPTAGRIRRVLSVIPGQRSPPMPSKSKLPIAGRISQVGGTPVQRLPGTLIRKVR